MRELQAFPAFDPPSLARHAREEDGNPGAPKRLEVLGDAARADPVDRVGSLRSDKVNGVAREEDPYFVAFVGRCPGDQEAEGCPRRILGPCGDVDESPGQLGLFGHREDLVPRHLAGHLGMILADMGLDARDQLVVGLAAHGVTAFAVDDLRHRFLPVVGDGIVE